MAKSIFDEKVKAQIREQISILDVAQEYGLDTFRIGATYSIRGHESVRIYPATNSFFRNSTSEGGDIFRFMSCIPEINKGFKDVYFEMIKKIDRSIDPSPQKKIERKNEDVTQRNTYSFNYNESLNKVEERESLLKRQFKEDYTTKNVKAYLIQTRGLDPEIVNEFISKGYIKQETNEFGYKNAVFIGYTNEGYIGCVCKRACSSQGKFKGDTPYCNYAYGWHYDSGIKDIKGMKTLTEIYDGNKPLICFEGYIDMMAYITLLKIKGEDYTQYSYMACGSVNKYPSIICEVQRSHYSDVIIAFDNDEAGDKHSELLSNELKERFSDIKTVRQKSYLKDWDEDLMKIRSKSKSLEERAKEAADKKDKAGVVIEKPTKTVQNLSPAK